jgi:predicted deacylase
LIAATLYYSETMSETIRLRSKQVVGETRGPHLLITGGVHGDEFESMAAIRRLMRHLQPPEIRGRVTLVPIVNEAAFLHGQRTAEDGLDLARTCPGRADGSVTERIAHVFSELIRTVDFYIDLHSGGINMSVLPMSGYCLHANQGILEQQRTMARAFNLPIVWGTAATLPGRSLSIARDAGVPAIYAEYHGSGLCDPSGVDDYFHGCLNVMAAVDMIDQNPPPSRIEHVVEDPRPDSGHMQVRNLSPMTGFFEPAVRLGDLIKVDVPIGTVSDPLGETVRTVRSTHEGIVLTLRTFSRVKEGESLGVILEMGREVEQV